MHDIDRSSIGPAVVAAIALTLCAGAPGRAQDEQGDLLSRWPKWAGTPTAEQIQALRTAPAGYDVVRWWSTAKELGVSLAATPEDREGVVDGFRFDKDDYPSLEQLTVKRASQALGLGVVHQHVTLQTDDGREIEIGLSVGQRTPLDTRVGWLRVLLAPGPAFASPVKASDVGLTVGQAATAGRVDEESGQRWYTHAGFYRRNVSVTVRQDAPVTDLAALAKAIDAKIQDRPLVPDLRASKLRPRIGRFNMERASTTTRLNVEGSAEWHDPGDRATTANVHSKLGMVGIGGGKVSYTPVRAGEDIITLMVANDLNLSDEREARVTVR